MMLELRGVETRYGSSQVLFGVDLSVAEGQMVALLGRNGMGKSTTIRSIMGLTPPFAGTITLNGAELQHLPVYRIARLGIGLVPEGRQIFPTLTACENLTVVAANFSGRSNPYTIKRIYDIFPRLAERAQSLGSELSGGEQQMLAIGRALMTNPRLLLLDEATEGLAPLIREEIWRGLTILKERGLSVLVIDKNINNLKKIVERHFIMERGRVVWSGESVDLTEAVQKRYLGI
ncbi:MAG: ABC transporter ATP-binding protein [Desulfobulbaceae bacterium]|uniref:ABC transporter ATP-binding protein n=1 Tax=Candidatus Desulfatifera sulfidica TaxID=2841691 RepID=A0A8J6TA05_9BACT|nr:ABC transporter ATP-binding protein [Candidatus Desulfatifera sulfidica]